MPRESVGQEEGQIGAMEAEQRGLWEGLVNKWLSSEEALHQPHRQRFISGVSLATLAAN